MNLAPSEERDELRKALRSFLAAHSAESDVRRLMETPEGYDREQWARLAGELGLTGLCIPAEYGGSDATFAEVGVVLEEMGRTLTCAPYLSTVVLATGALLHIDDEAARKDHLPGIAAGETIATVAVVEESGRWDPADVATTATRGATGWELHGTKMFVIDGHIADLLLVAARTGDGEGSAVSLFAVDGTAPGLTRAAMPTLDLTRRQARLDLDAVPGRLVGPEGGAGPTLEHLGYLAAIALACEQVGGAAQVLETAVAYARTRVQFGRPIGQFQAIKHRCADMALELDAARTALAHGLWAAATSDPELPVAASIAKIRCSECFAFAAAENVQIHGGIGFSWEHSAHLYFRRATSNALMFGDPSYHREQLIRQLEAAGRL
ncbi:MULTISPECIES: acyl-CoA dehydrogenase family protein [Pseudofrankia]|uniref:acyl-CoA dehydrogenase family protein n=1 Tax=Pseudofrankia TaxID=2994363 RepID=UPI000234D82F|nr:MULTISPECIES: acyl-CoA dehydrogenase family protein [Pseudofrankia]OHV31872.1 acyl-CoA dehydrogenase [Pseudofrankia sp. EUN1h]